MKRILHRWIWVHSFSTNPDRPRFRYQRCPICNLLRRKSIAAPTRPKKGLTPRPQWEYKLDSNFAPLLRVPPCPGGPKKEESA